MKNKKYSLLIISGEKFSEKMAGIAMRQLSIAKCVSKIAEVIIATPYESKDIDEVSFITYNQDDTHSLEDIVREFDIILFQGHILHHFPFLKKTDKVIIVDIFSPIIFESFNWHQFENFDKRIFYHDLDLSVLIDQLEIGDFFLCSNDVQRHFWIGMLAGLNRVSPYTIDHDDELEKLIAVVPYGISEMRSEKSMDVIKGIHPRVKKEDHLLIWNGGIYNWLDPMTPIKAMVRICQDRSDVKLFFLGTKHPNPQIPVMPICLDAIKLSENFGLADLYVFFLEWTDAASRYDYILESDATLSFYHDNIETRFSFRTRLMDNIATGVTPIVTDCGDTFSKMIKDHHLGETIPPGDVDASVMAILGVIDDKELRDYYRKNLKSFSNKMLWDIALSPLMVFLSNPLKSPDFGKGPTEFQRIYSKSYYSPSEHKVYPSLSQYLDENDFTKDLKDLYVESSSYCNLKCEMCLISAPKTRIPARKPNGLMEFDTFRRLDDVLPVINFLSLNGTGEALLHPELFVMIEYAKKRMKTEAKISFNTNGMFLDKSNIEKIFETGVDIIIVSIDSPDKENYEQIRLKGDFDLMITNLKNLASEKKSRNSDKPEIGIETVAMKKNLHSLPAMVELARSVEASIFAVTNMVAYKKELANEILYEGEIRKEAAEIFAKVKELAINSGIENVRIPGINLQVSRKCWFYDKAIIKWDGSVMPCCQLVDSYR
ncbi:radical SAM protein, partial [bacterium]|nr:radical SAM protein [bacterium]